MDRISKKVYKVLNKRIPEEVLGMMTVAVSTCIIISTKIMNMQ